MMKKSVYVYAGRNDDNKKIFVEKKILDMDDSKTKKLMDIYSGMIAFAKVAKYAVVDISREPLDTNTFIVDSEMAMDIDNLQQGRKKK